MKNYNIFIREDITNTENINKNSTIEVQNDNEVDLNNDISVLNLLVNKLKICKEIIESIQSEIEGYDKINLDFLEQIQLLVVNSHDDIIRILDKLNK